MFTTDIVKIQGSVHLTNNAKQKSYYGNLIKQVASRPVNSKRLNQIWLAAEEDKTQTKALQKNPGPSRSHDNQITQLRINTEIHKHSLRPT